MSRKIRKRIYLAVEGESEQSFIKFLQQMLNQKDICVHLDCEVLGGGGYKPMLAKAITYRARREKSRGRAIMSILIVDTDRADKNEDGWSIETLISKANKKHFDVCLQRPNMEGLLLRLFPGNENISASAFSAHKQLLKVWHNYQKPADARTLMNKFSYDDVMRSAKTDIDLEDLLIKIGLLNH